MVPRGGDQQPEELLDGISVLSFPPDQISSSAELYKKINADIYHSCEPSFGTWIAMKHLPKATHIVTCRDPRDAKDWIMEFSYPSKSRLQVIQNYLYEYNWLVRKAVRNADAVFVPAHFLKEKVKRLYRYQKPVEFLPTPTEIPAHVVKQGNPSVLYMGRLDPRKRPELTLQLGHLFPEIIFHIVGKARVATYEANLKEKFRKQENIVFHGFVDQFHGDEHHQLLTNAAIHINTAVREGLPNSFVEAAGHKCAILSAVDPDQFASRFGYHAKDSDFVKGLENLLSGDLWKSKGEAGYEYVRRTNDIEVATDAHEASYHHVFSKHFSKNHA